MIEPATLPELLANDPVTPLRDAVTARLKTLFKGVTVKSHIGKLDIYDVVKRELVSAPGIAIGWTAVKSPRDVSGTYCMPVDLAAYIVTEHMSIGRQRVDRAELAHAIGTRLLKILHNADIASWGLEGITPPDGDPGPMFKPIFTATAYEKGTAYYAVTWTQMLIDLGEDFLGGPTPHFVAHDEERGPGLKFLDETNIPPEIAAMIQEDAENDGGQT
ncbi:hypothetical protein [Roseibium sp. MB-4]